MTARRRLRLAQLAAAIVLSLLSGCLIIPFPVYMGAPDVEPDLLADLGRRNDEILVLRHMSKLGHRGLAYRSWDEAPMFIKGTELAKWMNGATLEYGWGAIVWIELHVDAVGSTSRLMWLCLITADSQEIELRPTNKSWSVARKDVISAARRDALVSALRGAATEGASESPCGIEAGQGWRDPLRTRVIDFLVRLRPQATRPDERPSARFVAGARW